MNMKLRFATLIIIPFFVIAGCATERSISPSIEGSKRSGLVINPPVLGSVFDGRTTQDKKGAVKSLTADLSRIYGRSIEWDNYFAKVPKGRIAVRIRIVTLGASFGSRLVSSITFANAIGSAKANASGSWGSVVGSVSSEQSVFGGSFSGEGWWNGAAWIDIEIQDYRGPKRINFTLPIVAEHRVSNMWGYASGDKAARVAWNNVAKQLTRALDTIFRTIRDQQD